MTTDMHAKSNELINSAVRKCTDAMDYLMLIHGKTPEGMECTVTSFNKVRYTYRENGKTQISIFVTWWSNEGYRITAYDNQGFEAFDFEKIQKAIDAKKIIQLIAFSMKAGK